MRTSRARFLPVITVMRSPFAIDEPWSQHTQECNPQKTEPVKSPAQSAPFVNPTHRTVSEGWGVVLQPTSSPEFRWEDRLPATASKVRPNIMVVMTLLVMATTYSDPAVDLSLFP